MLNEYLLCAYRQDQTNLASRKLHEKLAMFSLEDLEALAKGDPTAKLAYCDSPEGGPQSWLDKYKGSALFDKAVALEKQLLEADAAADAKRDEERAADREVDAHRDALRMQKRMLDLDLALEREGGAAAESAEVPAAVAAPVVPTEPAPTGGGTAVEVKQASSSHNSAHVMEFYRKRAELLKTASAVGAFVPETRSLGKAPATDRAQGAGAGEYTVDPSETVTGGLQVNKVAARKEVSRLEEGMQPSALRRAAADAEQLGADIETNPGKYRLRQAIAGGVGGGALGTGLGTLAGGMVGKPGLGALLGAGVGTLAGGGLAALHRPSGAGWREEAATIRQHLGKEAGTTLSSKPVDKRRLAQEILREYPDFAPKKTAAIKWALSIGGIMQGAKALGTGAKNLATTANAAGGLPQVAKSFGSVAKGVAMKHPLATAGAAGLGGVALGRAVAPSTR